MSSRQSCELFENSQAAPPNSLTPRPRPKCGTETGRFRFWIWVVGVEPPFQECWSKVHFQLLVPRQILQLLPPHSNLLGRTNQTLVRPPLSWGHNTRPHKQDQTATDKKIDSDLQFLKISGRFSKVLPKFWSVALEVQKLKVFFGRTFRLKQEEIVMAGVYDWSLKKYEITCF